MIRSSPSFAVLTRAGAPFGLAFLRGLSAMGIRPALLVVEETPLSARLAALRRLARAIGWRDALRHAASFLRDPLLRAASAGRLRPLPDYRPFASAILRTRDINDPAVAEAVVACGAHFAQLAQSGIVRGALLERGIPLLNAHPGRLPDLRGVDVVRWALLEGEPLAATLHRVDAGIDTGPLLARLPVPVRRDDTVAAVVARADRVAVNLLLLAARLGPDAFGPARPQTAPRTPLRRLMPFAVARRLERAWPALRAARLAGSLP